MAVLLCAMIQKGLVQRITDQARIEDDGGLYTMPPGTWSDEQRRMHRLCQSRRGNDDLKRQSWSAYLALQKRFAEDETKILSAPCFLVYTERQQVVIVPGNCSPWAMLEFVATHRIRSLFFINGCVDEAIGVADDADYWFLDGLKFSDRAINIFAEEFAKERASMERSLAEYWQRCRSG